MNQVALQQSKVSGVVLHVAFELSNRVWKMASSVDGRSLRTVNVPARDTVAVAKEFAKAKRHFGVPESTPVRSCYEAGRDGFWLHRWLVQEGVDNIIVDAASIEVNRRARRAKTDRLDAAKLLQMLVRHHSGEPRVWSIVRVPSAEHEDARRPGREIERLIKERTGHSNRITALLIAQGLKAKVGRSFKTWLDCLRGWDGKPLAEKLKRELLDEYERWELVNTQLEKLRHEEHEAVSGEQPAEVAPGSVQDKARQLAKLRAIGDRTASVLANEFFWRHFRNRREVGAAAGLVGVPYSSGNDQREQGISKTGGTRVRAVAIELAWGWLRWQSQSELARWFEERFAKAGPRGRRKGIVAVARRLLIALWRYLEHGVVPAGAVFKAA